MEKIKESFFVDRNSKTIYSHTVWCRRYVKDLTPEETENSILNETSEVFVNYERDCLTPIPSEEIKSLWKSDIKNHIVVNSHFSLQEFEKGYCYTAELWKGKYGQEILILKYHH